MSDILDTLEELEDEDLLGEGDEDLLEEDSEELFEGELVELSEDMDEAEAQEITEAIKSAATATYILLAQAHERKAHKALGYATWADYVREEFEMSAQRSYQLLDLSKAVAMLEEAAPEGTVVKLTEAQARDIKRELPKITELVAEETREKTPEEAAEAVDAIIDEIREQKRAEEKAVEQKQKAAEEAEEEGYRAGLEAAADALLEADRPEGMTGIADDGLLELSVEGEDSERLTPEDSANIYNFFNVLSSIASLPEPDDFIRVVPTARAAEVEEQLLEATSWLNRFQTLWEDR